MGDPEVMLATVIALAAVLVATVTDLRRRVIPNTLTLAVSIVGLAFSTVTSSLAEHALAAGITLVVLLGVRALGHVIVRQPGLGMGDIKLGAALALLVGFHVLWMFYLAAVVGALVGVGARLMGRVKRREAIPFAPFILSGAVLALVFPFGPVWVWLSGL